MDVTIELGRVEDVDELEQLYNDLNDHLAAGTNYPGWKKGVYPARQTAINGINDGGLYVARHRNKIIGSMILNHEPEAAYYKVKWGIEAEYSDVFVIHTFAVHPHFFKRGVGRAFMDFAMEYGVKAGAKAIRLDVYENNIPARKLYEKFGFQYVDRVDLGYGIYGLNWFILYEKNMSAYT